jgi:hypothetical protein
MASAIAARVPADMSVVMDRRVIPHAIPCAVADSDNPVRPPPP